MPSPAKALQAGKVLTLAEVAEGAEGLVLADLARSIAAKADASAISFMQARCPAERDGRHVGVEERLCEAMASG